AATAGAYYVQVKAQSWSGGSTFKLEGVQDDYGNSIATATAVTASGTVTNALLESPSDLDLLKFTATANKIYKATVTMAGAIYYGATVRILDGNGFQVATSGSTSNVSVAAFKAGAAGTYYVEISQQSYYWSGGSYTWKLEDAGTDDHGDTLATATAV